MKFLECISSGRSDAMRTTSKNLFWLRDENLSVKNAMVHIENALDIAHHLSLFVGLTELLKQ